MPDGAHRKAYGPDILSRDPNSRIKAPAQGPWRARFAIATFDEKGNGILLHVRGAGQC